MPADTPMVRQSDRVADFVRDYEFRGESDYSPSDNERALIEDAIHGFIADAPLLDPALVRDWIERVADGSMSSDDALAALSASPAREGSKPTGEQIVCGNDWQRRMLAPSPGEGDAPVAWRGPGEKPHDYFPDIMAMGDCMVCGHIYEAHRPENGGPRTRPTPATPEGLREALERIATEYGLNHTSKWCRDQALAALQPQAGEGE